MTTILKKVSSSNDQIYSLGKCLKGHVTFFRFCRFVREPPKYVQSTSKIVGRSPYVETIVGLTSCIYYKGSRLNLKLKKLSVRWQITVLTNPFLIMYLPNKYHLIVLGAGHVQPGIFQGVVIIMTPVCRAECWK